MKLLMYGAGVIRSIFARSLELDEKTKFDQPFNLAGIPSVFCKDCK